MKTKETLRVQVTLNATEIGALLRKAAGAPNNADVTYTITDEGDLVGAEVTFTKPVRED